jgi:hypothetical protein
MLYFFEMGESIFKKGEIIETPNAGIVPKMLDIG